MNIELKLKQMALLEIDINREILRLLLYGPKDFNSLCREIKKSRSAIFDGLKELREAKMVDREKIRDESKGRPGYEYYIENFHIPELSRTNLLDFLNGIDVTSKFITLTEISAIDDLSRYIPVSVELFLNLMLSSGISFKYALQVLVELGSRTGKDLNYDEVIGESLNIMKEKYPIDKSALDRFKDRATMEIEIFSRKGTMTLKQEKMEEIAARELGLEKFESKFISSKILMVLRLLGINKIPYTVLINLLYMYSENLGILCKRVPYFYNISKFPSIEGFQITVIVKNREEKWSLINISDYFLRKWNLEKTKCDFLAHLMMEKLLVLGLERYSVELIESLTDELIREYRI